MHNGNRTVLALLVSDNTVFESEQGVIPAGTDAFSSVESGANLANKNVAGQNFLTTVALHATSLTYTVATVSGTTASFFMSHVILPSGSYAVMDLTLMDV